MSNTLSQYQDRLRSELLGNEDLLNTLHNLSSFLAWHEVEADVCFEASFAVLTHAPMTELEYRKVKAKVKYTLLQKYERRADSEYDLANDQKDENHVRALNSYHIEVLNTQN
jgi:hypothetical protein